MLMMSIVKVFIFMGDCCQLAVQSTRVENLVNFKGKIITQEPSRPQRNGSGSQNRNWSTSLVATEVAIPTPNKAELVDESEQHRALFERNGDVLVNYWNMRRGVDVDDRDIGYKLKELEKKAGTKQWFDEKIVKGHNARLLAGAGKWKPYFLKSDNNTKYAAMRKAWQKGLDWDQYMSVMLWTNSADRSVNRWWYQYGPWKPPGGGITHEKEADEKEVQYEKGARGFIFHMLCALYKVGSKKYDTLYRVEKSAHGLHATVGTNPVGEIYTSQAFWSTTTSSKPQFMMISQFAGKAFDVKIIIKSAEGHSLGSLSAVPAEKEVLLLPGSKFKVLTYTYNAELHPQHTYTVQHIGKSSIDVY